MRLTPPRIAKPPFAGPLALFALAALAASIRPILKLGQSLGDTDDAMRLVQVRALLDGRTWYDLIEPRLNPPAGLHVHWSRLVDAPIAALLALGRAVFGPDGGETFVRIVWPLLLFAGAGYLIVRMAERTSGRTAAWIAAALTASCGMLWLQFEPGRLDHHNVQLLLMAAMMTCAIGFADARKAGAMGLLAGVSLAVGFESLPVIAWAGALAAAFYLFTENGARAAAAFGLAFAASAAACFLAQTPPSFWTFSACDALSFNGVLAALIAGLGLAAAARFVRGALAIRLAAAGAAGFGAAFCFLALHPSCLHGPYGDLDPRLIPIWLNRVGEAQTLASWLASEPIMAISGALLPLATLAGAAFFIWRGERDRGFLALAALLGLTCLVGLIQVRGLVLASAAAIPLAANLLARLRPLGALTPMGMGVLLGLAASPLSAQIALNTMLPAPVRAKEAKTVFDQDACFKTSQFAGLAALPPGTVLADLDAGPHIIAHTRLSAVAGPYQRIDHAMLDSILVFSMTPEDAVPIVRETHADYIALCRKGVFAAHAQPGTLAARLLAGQPPSWARIEPARAGGYAIFKVERNRLPFPDEIRGRAES